MLGWWSSAESVGPNAFCFWVYDSVAYHEERICCRAKFMSGGGQETTKERETDTDTRTPQFPSKEAAHPFKVPPLSKKTTTWVGAQAYGIWPFGEFLDLKQIALLMCNTKLKPCVRIHFIKGLNRILLRTGLFNQAVLRLLNCMVLYFKPRALPISQD